MNRWVMVAMLSCMAAPVSTGGARAQGVPKATDVPPHPERALMEAMSRVAWFGPDHSVVKASEASAMLAAILKGGSMGGGEGWFGPGASRYSWKWLAARHQVGEAGAITRRTWRGPAETFSRLDRNRDGKLTATDFDWAEHSVIAQRVKSVMQWLMRIDAGPKRQGDFQKILLKGFMASELGSPFEGPRVNQPAPDFTLATHDGKQKITLSDSRGKKPVVLIFGSVT